MKTADCRLVVKCVVSENNHFLPASPMHGGFSRLTPTPNDFLFEGASQYSPHPLEFLWFGALGPTPLGSSITINNDSSVIYFDLLGTVIKFSNSFLWKRSRLWNLIFLKMTMENSRCPYRLSLYAIFEVFEITTYSEVPWPKWHT